MEMVIAIACTLTYARQKLAGLNNFTHTTRGINYARTFCNKKFRDRTIGNNVSDVSPEKSRTPAGYNSD